VTIETVNLECKYEGRYVLQNVNLKISQGEVFTLIGPTGAGKTTLLRLLDLLEKPTAGKIYIGGTDVTHSAQQRQQMRRRMAFVGQKPVVFGMTVAENIACGLRWRGASSQVIQQKVANALRLVGMSDYQKSNAKTLSGGEAQRVAIARALVIGPEVLFLDEPTANLDPISTSRVEDILAQVIREGETTVVMATHDMSQAQRLAGRIGVLINGQIRQVDAPGALFSSPASKEVAEFVGVENILSGVVVKNEGNLITIDINGKALQAIAEFSAGDKIYALVRPEDIILTVSRDASSARNAFAGQVTEVVSQGPLSKVRIDCGFPLLVLVTRRSADEMGLTTGSSVFANFKATAIRTISRWR
jgi:tungstate transport system ATP-binding protein